MIGTGLYLVVVAIMSIGIGAIIRNIAGAIGALVGILIIVPAITSSLSQVWANRLNKWMPSTAGQAIMSPQSDTTMLAPWRGLGLFLLYALATVTVAAIMLRRRDA